MGASFGSSGSNDDEMITAINITPLVDVVLVLLIIFMMTAPVIYQSSIKVQLPKASSGEEVATDKRPLQFTLTREGELSWDGTKINWESLPTELKKRPEDPEASAIIHADQAVSHGTVVKLMDLLRQAGIYKFAMSVEK